MNRHQAFGICAALFLGLTGLNQGFAQTVGDAIATLSGVEGYVEVTVTATRKTRRGREGLMLYAGEQVHTGKASKATVEFRDGSRFRLFRETDFLIESGSEQQTRERTFKFQLALNIGSLQGRLRRGRQRTRLRTPTAIIGVKGTSVRVTELAGGKVTVALSEGLLEVGNAVSTIELNPGQWLPEITRTDDLSEKIAGLPNTLFLNTEQYELDFSDGKPKQLFISIQMEDAQSGKITKRSGPVLLESDYYSIRMPALVSLDADGFIRIPVKIDPPRENDPEFNGLILVRANMDEIGFDDVGEGMIVLRVVGPSRERTLLIEPQSDRIEVK